MPLTQWHLPAPRQITPSEYGGTLCAPLPGWFLALDVSQPGTMSLTVLQKRRQQLGNLLFQLEPRQLFSPFLTLLETVASENFLV